MSQSDSMRNDGNPSAAQQAPVIGYNNIFTEHAHVSEAPPAYRPGTLKSSVRVEARSEEAHESLPAYECTVSMSGDLGLKFEKPNPFVTFDTSEWNDVHAALEGTKLSIYKLEGQGKRKKKGSIEGPGRILRQYTLQHGEVGVATDFKRGPLIPKSFFTKMLPDSARERVWETDPQLFEPVRQNAIRLRLETEQFLLGFDDANLMLDWVEALCAAIDISPDLDDRSPPRYHTVPRRRRRPDVGFDVNGTLQTSRDLIEEQERILREMYPHFAQRQNASRRSGESNRPVTAGHPDREDDEMDRDLFRTTSVDRVTGEPTNTASSSGLESIARSSPSRPSPSRNTTASSTSTLQSVSSMMSSTTFTTTTTTELAEEKWDPRVPHPTEAQHYRYRRRCAPALLVDSPRAGHIYIKNGKRYVVCPKTGQLVEWTLPPPTYHLHNFESERSEAQAVAPVSEGLGVTVASETTEPITAQDTLAVVQDIPSITITESITTAPSAPIPQTSATEIHITIQTPPNNIDAIKNVTIRAAPEVAKKRSWRHSLRPRGPANSPAVSARQPRALGIYRLDSLE